MEIDEIYGYITKFYPDLNITQLGMACLMLGGIRASMGHENAVSTIQDYIHPNHLSPNVRKCLDFIEREVLAIKKSKIDIDYWKRGNKGEFRRDNDKVEAVSS